MRMSDVIEEFIKDLFDDNNEYIEIQWYDRRIYKRIIWRW